MKKHEQFLINEETRTIEDLLRMQRQDAIIMNRNNREIIHYQVSMIRVN